VQIKYPSLYLCDVCNLSQRSKYQAGTEYSITDERLQEVVQTKAQKIIRNEEGFNLEIMP
jgi:hypothetical protein